MKKQSNSDDHPYNADLKKWAYVAIALEWAGLIPWILFCVLREHNYIFLWASAGCAIFAVIFVMYRSALWAKGGGILVGYRTGENRF